jgi:hypothetical protein
MVPLLHEKPLILPSAFRSPLFLVLFIAAIFAALSSAPSSLSSPATTTLHNEARAAPRHRECYLSYSLGGYDGVRGPPRFLPPEIYSVFVTDKEEAAVAARRLGWNASHFISVPPDVDPLELRRLVCEVRFRPELTPPLRECSFVHVVDASVIELSTSWRTCLSKLQSDRALLVTTGYYEGERDDIEVELHESVVQERWRYNWDAMTQRTREYQDMLEKATGTARATVASAKFIVWNMHHRRRTEIADWLLEEAGIHLQGNIYMSVAARLFPDVVQSERCWYEAKSAPHEKDH